MDERMVQRVMDELRADHPHDDDELLRALATKTMFGAALAFRLALADCGRAIRRAFCGT